MQGQSNEFSKEKRIMIVRRMEDKSAEFSNETMDLERDIRECD